MHNGPYVTVTECATRRRWVGKFHLSCSECGLLSSHARPVAPPPVTSANVIKTCIASRLLSLHVRPVAFVCLFFKRKPTSTVNASVGHCMKDRWPPPLVRSQFQKELAVDVVRSSAMGSLCPNKSMQVSSHVVCSQFHKEFAVDVGCYHFLYDPGTEPPLSILQLKENFNSECQCHRIYDPWLFRSLLYHSRCSHCMYSPWMYDPWLSRLSPLQLKKYLQCKQVAVHRLLWHCMFDP